MKIWAFTTGKEIFTLREHTDRVYGVAFSPDGRFLASGSGDQTVRVWDAETGQLLANLGGHAGYVWSVAFSPDGRRLASGSGYKGKGEIKLWDASLWQNPASGRR